tara:strand:+ start:1482 stop:1928 length:447 start_codon:yes stop_codon:yes gene_type:complete
MSDWFDVVKNRVDDFDEARRILNRPMAVEEWMKPYLKPHKQEKSCCEYTQERLRLMPQYNQLDDDFVSYIMDIDCKLDSDELLQLLEDLDDGGMEVLNQAMQEAGGEISIGELDLMVKTGRELLEFWQKCEEESADKKGIQEFEERNV